MSLLDAPMLRNFAIGFALGAAGLFAVSGFPIETQAIASVLN
ncbi:hypothetical protein [Croceicoccus naphthovorans]|nr:hypothetical protein [Croceicoccus naphthovorans]MBB3989251.1 hypothetical protein [Croceicoccus naphthovorans]